jgi:hypothetical protein
VALLAQLEGAEGVRTNDAQLALDTYLRSRPRIDRWTRAGLIQALTGPGVGNGDVLAQFKGTRRVAEFFEQALINYPLVVAGGETVIGARAAFLYIRQVGFRAAAGQLGQAVRSGFASSLPGEVAGGTTGAESAFQAERLRASLSAQELSTAPRVGSGLKADPFHRATSWVVDDVAQSGRVFPLRGGDGVQRTLTQVETTIDGQRGVAEWIVDPAGNVTHQRFIPGGRITGSPNQVP